MAALALVAAVAATVGWRLASAGSGDRCEDLGARVAGFSGFSWDNGMTSSGSEWISVLSDGVTQSAAVDHEAIALAARADDDGFDRFRSALPDDLRSAADRQRSLATDLGAGEDRQSERAASDATSLRRHGTQACGLA